MNTKSMAKTGTVIIILAVIIFLLVTPFFSSAIVEETYVLGDKIRINLRGYGSYKMKIETPNTQLIKQGINNIVLFTPEETGNYSIELQYGRETKYYTFEVLEKTINETNKTQNNKTNQTANETFLNKLMIEREVIIGQPVKWIKKGNIALGTRRTKIDIPLDGEDISVYSVGQERKKVDFEAIVEENKGQKSVILNEVYGDIEVVYHTEGPKKQEKTIGRKKQVTIYYDGSYDIENIAAYSDIEEISKIHKGIKVYWVEENKYIDFETFDLDGDGFIDRIMWMIPHLSNQTFEIIVISQAEHLDNNREFIEDVYPEVSIQDGIWENIPNKDYLRVVFEKNLTNKNDITLYARGSGTVEVYEKNKTQKITEFNITGENWYKEYLSELMNSQDTFDLLVLGDVDFDLIIDPTTGGTTTGGLRPQSVTCYNDGVTETCDGSYPNNCGNNLDLLSCNDAYYEYQSTEDGLFGGVSATYYDSTITDCVLINHVDICYEWRTTRNDPTDCEISVDNDNPDTFVEVISACPGTAGASGCYDVTQNETDWDCENFFGSTGERAQARAYITSTNRRSTETEVDQLWFNVTYQKAGYLNGTLNEPSTTELANNKTIYETFLVNASVECLGDAGDGCGAVTGYLMYNSTSDQPDSDVSTTPGAQPLFSDTGSQSCGDMNATTGQNYCELIWIVNTTQLGNWKIDVNFTSSYTAVYQNETKNANISVYNPPTLTINLTYPPSDVVINESDSTTMNCTANCTGQSCENIVVYPIYCQGSGCTPNQPLTTTSTNLTSDVNSANLGTLAANSIEQATFNITSTNYGEYVLSCNASSTNDGNPESPTTRPLTINSPPNATFTYPAPNEWLHATETLNASTSSDVDGTIVNYKFEIDDNIGFATPLEICNGASEECNLNTSSQTQCSQETNTCYLRLETIDNHGARNSTTIQIGIDNVEPSIELDLPHNNSYISVESQTVNSSATDAGSGMDCIEFSAYYDGGWNVINLDCESPYEHNWDLTTINDQILQVRARANDSENNWGTYDKHENITHDTTLPIAILDSPVDDEIINETTYLLNASSSYNGLAGMKNASFYYENSTDFGLIGEDLDASDGLTYSWAVDIGDSVYNISVNVTDKAGHTNSTQNENITIDILDDAPTCTVIYPNGYENVTNTITINATASEADPSDHIANLSFEYTKDGTTWNLIGYNLTSDLTYYTLTWNTSEDSDGTNYKIRCNITDSRNSLGTDSSNNDFSVDNTAPNVTNAEINSTYVEVNAYMCFNVTVKDNIIGVQNVKAEINFPTGVGGSTNLTLYDTGGNCDESAGDDVYSNRYLVNYDGEYNWSYTYATDKLGNLNKSLTSLNWSGYSDSYLITKMLEPTSNIEINESGIGSYYYQTCNITCNQSGGTCNEVYIFPQYYSGGWIDIETSGDDLFNEADNYSCGTLAPGVECNYTFNISANYSGGNTYQIRCRGSSSNAAADSSTPVELHVNDFPTATFTYPAPNEWLHATETLNASASSDVDGTIVNYKFEIDDNLGFTTPITICDSASSECSLNTSSQTECGQETNTCYLKLEVKDNDGTTNYTILQVGIDNTASGVELNNPYNYTNITSESYTINGSGSDSGSGIDCIEFSAYYDGDWNVINLDCESPYEYNWDLTTINDQIMQVRARANDTESNWGTYDKHENITHDTTPPSITLNYPDNNSYINQSALNFNFTGEDTVAELLECKLLLNQEINQTNSSVLNGTTTQFNVELISDGEYNWSVNCNDYRTAENSSETRKLTIDTILPVVNLNHPLNNSWLNTSSVDFNYTPIDDNLDSCELWGNWSTWHLNETNTTVENNQINTFNKNLQDGTYYWNIKCNDSAGNTAFNSTNLTFNIDTTYPQIYFNPSTTQENYTSLNEIFINITAIDSKKDSVRLAWTTNETFDFNEGNYYWENKTGLSEGTYNFYAWINDTAGNYNQTVTRTIVVDLTSPNYSKQNQTIGGYVNIVHRDQKINLSASWTDNINLSSTWLSTNESGTWKNQTPKTMTGANNISEFQWTNTSINPGEEVSWKIYTNDTVGNYNFTNDMKFTVWGWSEVDISYVSPSGVKQGELTTMYCEIQDNVSKTGIQGYPVYFYNNSQLLGTNTTGADGFAEYTINITEAGSYTITCNISDNSTRYYNASSNYQGSAILGIGFGESAYDYKNLTYHRAFEGTTQTTTTQVNNYPALQYNDASTEQYLTAGIPGLYAYQRFEMKIEEDINEVTQMNITWTGYGAVNSGTDGYILYVYNFTSQTWMQMATYTGTETQQTSYIGFSQGFNDTINSTGWVWILARSYSAAPSPNPKTAEIGTNYIELRIRKDIIPPTVTLQMPQNYYNSSISEVIFNCTVEDDKNINNVTLYGTWHGGWHENETDESKLNNINYTFNKSIEEGKFEWNCYACDKADNCDYALLNYTFTIDQTGPEINLLTPVNYANFSYFTIEQFNFTAEDNTSLQNCSLWGNWSTWHLNQTILNPPENTELNFSSKNVTADGYYTWNVECYDIVGNPAFNSTNYTFSAFLFPENVSYINATQTKNDGTGQITLYWEASNHTLNYNIYYSNTLTGTYTLLNITSETNYTDTTFSGTRRFYRIDSWNPIGQNSSENYFGAHVYTLRHNTNSKNWIGFPTDFVNLDTANQTLREIRNATAFAMWNATDQKKISCTEFLCPNGIECTNESCNFNLKQGKGYEVYVDTNEPNPIQWSGVGIVYKPGDIPLETNSSDFSKNWISLYAGTTLSDAQDLIQDIPNADAVTQWDNTKQTTKGLISSFLEPGQYIGQNFNLNIEEGYETSITSSGTWSQS